MTAPNHPVPRRRVLAGALVALIVLGAALGLTEWLRHPPANRPSPIEPGTADVRAPVTCPDPAPREDRPTRRTANPGPPIRVSSSELYDCPASHDRQLVTFEGEAVGALLARDGGAWTQLNDDVYAGDLGPLPSHRDFRGGNAGVGVFLPADLAEQIEHVGGPHRRGDIVAVTGTFHRVDPTTNEIAVIRAVTATVRTPGEPIDHPPLRDRRIVGVLLALAAVGASLGQRAAGRR